MNTNRPTGKKLAIAMTVLLMAMSISATPVSAGVEDTTLVQTTGIFCDPASGLCVSGAGATNCGDQLKEQTDGENDADINTDCSSTAMCGEDIEWQIEAKIIEGLFEVKWKVGCDGVSMAHCWTNSTEGASASACVSAGIKNTGELFCEASVHFGNGFSESNYEAKCVDPMRPDRAVPAVIVFVNETAEQLP